MTTVSVKANLSDKEIKKLFKKVGNEALFAEKSALRSTARKSRTSYVRSISQKESIPQRPIRKRTNHYPKKTDKTKQRAGFRLWVGVKNPITEKEVPKLLKLLKGLVFVATMPSGYSGSFVKGTRWENGRKNTYQTVPGQPNRFIRPDKQWTHLPVNTPKVSLADTGRELVNICTSAMRGTYPDELRKELTRRVARIRKRR